MEAKPPLVCGDTSRFQGNPSELPRLTHLCILNSNSSSKLLHITHSSQGSLQFQFEPLRKDSSSTHNRSSNKLHITVNSKVFMAFLLANNKSLSNSSNQATQHNPMTSNTIHSSNIQGIPSSLNTQLSPSMHNQRGTFNNLNRHMPNLSDTNNKCQDMMVLYKQHMIHSKHTLIRPTHSRLRQGPCTVTLKCNTLHNLAIQRNKFQAK